MDAVGPHSLVCGMHCQRGNSWPNHATSNTYFIIAYVYRPLSVHQAVVSTFREDSTFSKEVKVASRCVKAHFETGFCTFTFFPPSIVLLTLAFVVTCGRHQPKQLSLQQRLDISCQTVLVSLLTMYVLCAQALHSTCMLHELPMVYLNSVIQRMIACHLSCVHVLHHTARLMPMRQPGIAARHSLTEVQHGQHKLCSE